MASLIDDDKLQDPNAQQNAAANPDQSNTAAQTSGPTDLSSGSSSSDVTGAAPQASSAGIGDGGSGGWTNIQSYLNANKDNSSSADDLNSKVGTQFDKEQSDIDSASNAAKGSAQSQVDSVANAQTNASDWINQAAKEYSYDGNQNQDYTDTTGKLKTAYNGAYTGPTDYSYGLSADTQNYGAALSDPTQFNQFMGDIYNDKAGGQLTSGGRQLQTQLDVNNTALDQARQSLASKYTNLGDYLNQNVTDTNTALGNAQTAYQTNQNSLKDYLNNSLGTENSAISKAEDDARNSYANDLTQNNDTITNNSYGLFHSAQDLQNWQRDNAGSDWMYTDVGHNRPVYQVTNDLNNFNTNENAKYANAGDSDKRQYNTLEDILDGSDKKNQNFAVKGT